MDIKTHISSIAEAKTIYELTRMEYHVFNQVTGKAPFDLIAYKNGEIFKISVKSILKKNRYGKYEVQLKRVRSNKTCNTIYKFNNKECDILAVYIYEIDVLLFIKSSEINTGCALTLSNAQMESRKAGVLMGLENLEVDEIRR